MLLHQALALLRAGRYVCTLGFLQTSEARREEGGFYGVRNDGGVCSSDHRHEASYPGHPTSQIVVASLGAASLATALLATALLAASLVFVSLVAASLVSPHLSCGGG